MVGWLDSWMVWMVGWDGWIVGWCGWWDGWILDSRMVKLLDG
jgi:hypothetical protein